MPIIGLGVWRMEGKSVRDLVLNSIKIGYRHFKQGIESLRPSQRQPRRAGEEEVGNLPLHFFPPLEFRSWHVIEACKDSLQKLHLDYLDLYLVHFPVATKHTGVGTTSSALDEHGVLEIDTTIYLETTWHAMENLVSKGLVRSIGISNYDVFLTEDCLAYSKIKSSLNQSKHIRTASVTPSSSYAKSMGSVLPRTHLSRVLLPILSGLVLYLAWTIQS